MAKIERRLLIGERIIFALIADGAAIHFWVKPDWQDIANSYGGVEIHCRPQEGQEPDNQQCWLLGGPCCHDGSSLYASEKVIPLFHDCCEIGDGNYEPVWNEVKRFLNQVAEQLKGK